jgi:DNA-directed RNA polymerase specialized sigma24 family protein
MMERELRDRAAAGEVEAFSELIRRHLPATFDFSARLLRDQDEARSLMSEVVSDAAQPGALTAAETFSALLLSSALEKASQRLRRHGGLAAETLTLNAPVDEMFCRGARAATDLETADPGLQILVWQVAASLDRRQFALLDLHLRQRLPAAELAAVVSMPAATLESTTSRMEHAVESAMSAVVISQRGRRWCRDLDMLMADEDSLRISEQTRKRLEEHCANCTACTQTGQRYGSFLDVYRSLQPVHPPPGLRAVVLGPAIAALQEKTVAVQIKPEPAVAFRPRGNREPVVSVTGRISTLTTGLKVDGSRPIVEPFHDERAAPRFRASREPLQGGPQAANGSATYSYTPAEQKQEARKTSSSFYLILGGLAVVGLLGLGLLLFLTRDSGSDPVQTFQAETAANQTSSSDEPTLTFNASSVEFGASQSERVLTLETSADSTLTWTITADQPWLTIEPSGGSIDPGQTVAVSLAVNRGSLPEGLHTASLVLATSDEQTELPVEVVIPGTGPSISDERLNAPQDPETGVPHVFQAGCEPQVTAFRVSALIEDPSGVADVTLVYTVGSDEPLEATMEETGGRWEGAVPPLTRSGNIVYHILATDEAGNTSSSTPVNVELRSCTAESAT